MNHPVVRGIWSKSGVPFKSAKEDKDKSVSGRGRQKPFYSALGTLGRQGRLGVWEEPWATGWLAGHQATF